jgi:hypothetical protein
MAHVSGLQQKKRQRDKERIRTLSALLKSYSLRLNFPIYQLPILPIVARLIVLLTNQKDYEHIKQKGVRVTVEMAKD